MAEEVSVAASESSSSQLVDPENDEAGGAPEMEYETQYFGFTPQSFCDGVYNAVLGYTWDASKAVQEYLQEEFRSVVPPEQLESATKELVPRMTATIDKAFDKLEVYLTKNLFSLPPHVVLPEDRVHLKYPYTEEEVAALDEEIAELKRKVMNAKFMIARHRQECLDLQRAQGEVDKTLEVFTLLEKFCREHGAADCQEAMTNNVEGVIGLKNTLESIPPLELGKKRMLKTSNLNEKIPETLMKKYCPKRPDEITD